MSPANPKSKTTAHEMTSKLVVKNPSLADDRVHPNLLAVKTLALACNGWEADKRSAKEAHLNTPSTFGCHIIKMKYKQRVFDGDRSSLELQKLDALALTFPGWQVNKVEAEKDLVSKSF